MNNGWDAPNEETFSMIKLWYIPCNISVLDRECSFHRTRQMLHNWHNWPSLETCDKLHSIHVPVITYLNSYYIVSNITIDNEHEWRVWIMHVSRCSVKKFSNIFGNQCMLYFAWGHFCHDTVLTKMQNHCCLMRSHPVLSPLSERK